jgi:hypothetical protein
LLKKLSPRGRKPIRNRVEALISIDVHALITNRPGYRSFKYDPEGNRFDFIDEIVDGQPRLVIYINKERSGISYLISEEPNRGRFKHLISENYRNYYVIDNGKRYRYLYIDFASKKIGSRDNLQALYTSTSLRNSKQEKTWRNLQCAKKAKTWVRTTSPQS